MLACKSHNNQFFEERNRDYAHLGETVFITDVAGGRELVRFPLQIVLVFQGFVEVQAVAVGFGEGL